MEQKGKRKILHLGCGRSWKDIVNRTGPDKYNIFLDQLFVENVDFNDNYSIIGGDIFTYLEQYEDADIDEIIAHRVFEHIEPEKVLYLLYLLREVASANCIIDIIVPDFNKIAQDIQKLNPDTMSASKFNLKMVQCHTEIFNEPNDPHKSIWTEDLAGYYLQLENYWKIKTKQILTDEYVDGKYLEKSIPDIRTVCLDDRPWYIQIIAHVVKCDCPTVIDYKQEPDKVDEIIKIAGEGYTLPTIDTQKIIPVGIDDRKNYRLAILDPKMAAPIISDVANSQFSSTVQMLDDGTLKIKEKKITIAKECIKKEPDQNQIIIPLSPPPCECQILEPSKETKDLPIKPKRGKKKNVAISK